MDKLQKNDPEEIVYKGKIFEVIKQPMIAGGKEVTFEIARRSPGVRLIIVKEDKMLISREFRTELEDYDYRLPGGKLFDRLDEYNKHMSDEIMPFALQVAERESKEETGLIVNNIKHFATAQSGSTVVWDLFYFIVDDFEESEDGQELETGEVIHTEWKTFEEVRELCKNGYFNEDRSVGVLFKFFLTYPNTYTNK